MLGISIPAYRESKLINDTINYLINELGKENFIAVIVEDGCPDNTLSYIKTKDKRIHFIKNNRNYGVGYSTLKGFEYLKERNCTCLIKFDADGQHDSKHIMDVYLLCEEIRKSKLSKPFIIKGSRYEALSIGKVPVSRRIGSLLIEPLSRGAINYRDLSDIANGMICFSIDSYKILKKRYKIKIENRYLFESSIIANVGLLNFDIYEFPMDRIYNSRINSNMNEYKMILSILSLWLRTYFIRIKDSAISKIGLRTILLLISLIFANLSFFHYFLVIRKINNLGLFVSPGTAGLQIFFMTTFIFSLIVFYITDYLKCNRTIKFITKNFYK